MKLNEYIEQKKVELANEGMRKVEFKRARECEVGRNSISFMLFTAANAPTDAEVTEITANERMALPEREMIKAYYVDFDVVRPRCRKPVTETFYIKAL